MASLRSRRTQTRHRAYPRQRRCDETPDRPNETLPWPTGAGLRYTARRFSTASTDRPMQLDGLWRHKDFVRLWSSLTITHFGGQITFLALPLTGALLLDATPLEMGVLTALEALPFALFGLFAGVLVDRPKSANGSAS